MGRQRSVWPPERVQELVNHIAVGRGLSEAARLMGVTPRSAIGAHWRWVKNKSDPRRSPPVRHRDLTREHNLTEPWAVYSARKRAERAALKLAEQQQDNQDHQHQPQHPTRPVPPVR